VVWLRSPMVSTVLSSVSDSIIFFSLAVSGFAGLLFSEAQNDEVSWALGTAPFLNAGADVPLWVSLAVADWGVKMAIALVALIPFRIIVGRMLQRAG